ncbi:UPF0104 family protein [Neorhodopirellula pilleata]|uniref:Lysylphosphatidylglycerol synthase TM region n=1 Tax=Neorhodopirellula pilleata TaxID=2714738 RepID=A0A5C6AR04_9BACT|nr:UPF0104 family protein [Neorhodopirellula pilleata]TWU01901.1 hypothetical protein Pla100_16370 [Neorhodopirellula pilleata]
MPRETSWRRRFSAAVPWIRRAVFLLVLVGLIAATKESLLRWQNETETLRGQVDALMDQASMEPNVTRRAALVAEASRRESLIPSLGNLRWPMIACSGLFYTLGLLPPCWVLFRCLSALGVPCSLGRASAAQLLGHAGKYIPGKAMVVVLRVGAITPVIESTAGSTALIASAVFYETLLMMSVGGWVAGVLLWTSELPIWVRAMAALMAIGAIVPVCPPLMRRLIARVQKGIDHEDVLARLSWSLLVQCTIASLFSWLLIGLSFTLLIAAIPAFESIAILPSVGSLYWTATSAIALGMVLGFASLLPGGAGVRELVTLLILSPVIGATHALLAVIAARLMFILIESILAAFASLLIRRSATLSIRM